MLTLFILLAAFLVMLVSLSGSILFLLPQTRLQRVLPLILSLAVGVLLANAFLHLLPDALQHQSSHRVLFGWVLAGLLGFYFLERSLQHSHPQLSSASISAASYGKVNLIADGIHNFIDGVLIAGSFLVDPLLGVTTTVAILIHEIPQEIADVAVLLHAGFSRKKALLYNFLSAGACVLGAVATLAVSHWLSPNLSILLAITAGAFIYLASADLMPLLRKNVEQPFWLHGLMIGVGVMLMLLLIGPEASHPH
jgi:zinc and cadmium transporter